jgi:hypothetical protein
VLLLLWMQASFGFFGFVFISFERAKEIHHCGLGNNPSYCSFHRCCFGSSDTVASRAGADTTFWLTYWSAYSILFLDWLENFVGHIRGFYSICLVATVHHPPNV